MKILILYNILYIFYYIYYNICIILYSLYYNNIIMQSNLSGNDSSGPSSAFPGYGPR